MTKKIIILGILLFIATTAINAQNWAYVGNSSVTGNTVVTKAYGSAKTVFKSDGTPISVSLASNPSEILPRIYNGTAWVNLGTFSITGTIGSFDVEIYNDEPYIGHLSSAGFIVKKFDGTNWVQLGSTISGASGPYDFAIDNAGIPYVAFNNGKIYKFNGTAWSLIYTLPQSVTITILYQYQFLYDNTLTFDSNNDLIYNVTVVNALSGSYKQIVKKYNGASEAILGDTIIYNNPFTSYSTSIYTNSAGELYSLYYKAITNNVVVKKFNGTQWTTFGDTTNFRKNFAQPSFAFTGPNSFIVSGSGEQRKIYSCNGQSAAFQTIDTLNVTGLLNLAQITDLGVNPVSKELYATFNSFPVSVQDYSVMKHNPLTTNINNNQITKNKINIYPNPANHSITLKGIEFTDGVRLKIISVEGKTVRDETIYQPAINIDQLSSGTYFLEMKTAGGQLEVLKFIKQ